MLDSHRFNRRPNTEKIQHFALVMLVSICGVALDYVSGCKGEVSANKHQFHG